MTEAKQEHPTTKSMLDIHSEALRRPITPYHIFLQHYQKYAKVVYGFVEGKDDPQLYQGLVDGRLPADWQATLIASGNKTKVLQVLGLFDWSTYPRERICFFIDRDLSDFTTEGTVEHPNLYVTEGYSLENCTYNEQTFFRTLHEVYGLPLINPAERQQIWDKVEIAFEQFCQGILGIMAQIIIWRRNQDTAHLNNLNLKKIFFFSNDLKLELHAESLSREGRIEQLCNDVGASAAEPSHIDGAEREFTSSLNWRSLIRGKYVVWFFVSALNEVHSKIAVMLSNLQLKSKPKLTLGPGNCMWVLGSRVRCPDSLNSFIERNYLAFTSSFLGQTFNRLAEEDG